MSNLKARSLCVMGMLICLTLILSRPKFVYSQGGAENDLDQTPPTIEQVSPENGQTGIPIHSFITVTFSEVMDTFLTGNPFSISPATPGQIFWDLDQTLIFEPDIFLTYDTTYQVSVDTQAVDLFGNHLQSPYEWSFLTESNSWIHYFEIHDISLDQQTVQAILQANNGEIWVALGPSSNLFRFDGTGFNEVMEPLGCINALAQDNAGRIWVVSEPDLSQVGGGIHVYNGQNWTHYNSANSDLNDNNMKCITIDSKDQVWVGSSSSGIYRLNGQSWLNYHTGNSYLSDLWVTTLYADLNDHIWIGTVFGGIDVFNPVTGFWDTLTSDIESLLGNTFPLITAIAYGDGYLWIGSNVGLLRYHPGSGQWTLFSQQSGDLPNDYCTALLWDPLQNRIWVGTLEGSATYDGVNWDIISMVDAGPEIMNLELDHYGRIWMGTNNSLSIYDTDSPTLSSHTPVNNQKNVSVKSHIILNFSKPMDPDSVLGAFHITPSISFTYTWDSHYTRLTLKPKTQLNDNTEYHMSLTQEASDQIGHPLVDPYAWACP